MIDNLSIYLQTELSKLAGECFFNDPAFDCTDTDIRLKCLHIQTVFAERISLCQLYGSVQFCRDGEAFVGLVLSVEYNRIRSSNDHYGALFHNLIPSGPDFNANRVLYPLLDKQIPSTEKAVFVMAVGVHPNYRSQGIARRLLLEVFHNYPGYVFYTILPYADPIPTHTFSPYTVVEKTAHFQLIRYPAFSKKN